MVVRVCNKAPLTLHQALTCLLSPAAQVTQREGETISIQSQRTLSAAGTPFEHDFPVAVATTCYRSSYFSPYRMYTSSINADTPEQGVTFAFNVEVDECPYSKAFCCGQNLDHLMLKIGERRERKHGRHARNSTSYANAACAPRAAWSAAETP